MRRLLMIALPIALVASLTGCEKPGDKSAAEQSYTESAPPQGGAQAGAAVSGAAGTVVETMDSGGYTYVQVDLGGEKVWAAGPEFTVKVGDSVLLSDGMPMPNYHSNTLDRTFESILFCSAIKVAGAGEAARSGGGMGATSTPTGEVPPGHPPVTADAAVADMDFSGIAAAPGGRRIMDLYAAKGEMGGKEVSIRGKVVKVNNGIMGRNWFHLRDGSGAEGTNDITVTTDATVSVGQVVLVKGTVAVDKDFGAGYLYDIIIEGAAVTVE